MPMHIVEITGPEGEPVHSRLFESKMEAWRYAKATEKAGKGQLCADAELWRTAAVGVFSINVWRLF